MSWSNFEELKKFARKNENVKKKRPASSDGKTTSARKRRQTNNESLSFVSNTESTSEIEGFSTDEERDEERLECNLDSTYRNLSKPCVKRKYSSKWRTLSDKKSFTSDDGSFSHADTTHREKDLQGGESCDLMPDGAYELLPCSEAPKEDDIVWGASDDEELPSSVTCDGAKSDDTDSDSEFPSKHPTQKLPQGKALTETISNSFQPSENTVSGEVISDFQSDQESSQESLSADISTPTPTPVSPVVVGTPKTASEWLKQVQQKSPQRSEEEQSPEGRGVSMNCDSAKKKRKFIRSGLAEQLQHVISRKKSEKAFWTHRVIDTEKKPAGTSLQMNGSLVVQILSDQLQSSLHLTQCVLFSDDINANTHKLVFVLFSCDTWNQLAMQVGAVVNIHPPWQKLDITGCPWPVLLCTYYCEKHQSLEVQLPSVKGGLCIPLMRTSPSSSSLVQSPRKGFKPSKLLFGNAEDASLEQKNMASTSLTTVQPARAANRKPETSILNAIESCGGYSGALVTFQCLVQRVYCKKVKLARENRKNYRRSLLNQDLKSMAKSVDEDENEEIRWTLLVQDTHGMCAEIQVPPEFQESRDWHSCIEKGEGKVYTFSHMRVVQRTNRIRSAGLFTLIQSLWPLNDDNTVSSGSSQIATQESGSQATNTSSPPNFCYVLTLQESSRVSLCQDLDVCSEGRFLYKPYAFKALWDVLHDKHVKAQRISTLGKLLYCRSTGSSSLDSSFELFVTDSSLHNAPLHNAPNSDGRPDKLLRYVKVVGRSCHVLPPELRERQTNYRMILSAKHLLLKVQASHELVADAYSVIRRAVPQSATVDPSPFHDEHVEQDVLDKLTSLKPVCLPSLTLHSSLGYIYLIEGVVIGVDEETACCWLVCDTCGNRDITHGANSQFFCSSCNRAVESPQTRTHLAVFVKVKSFPADAHIKVTLQQSTINKLLPVCYQDNDQGYDIEAVLGKQLGSMSCYVTEHFTQQHGSLITYIFYLEEIQIH
ncbi:DNA repair-scaffolding protein-like [Oculina patagonica]